MKPYEPLLQSEGSPTDYQSQEGRVQHPRPSQLRSPIPASLNYAKEPNKEENNLPGRSLEVLVERVRRHHTAVSRKRCSPSNPSSPSVPPPDSTRPFPPALNSNHDIPTPKMEQQLLGDSCAFLVSEKAHTKRSLSVRHRVPMPTLDSSLIKDTPR